MNNETSSREKEIYKVTIVGSLVNFLLVLFKFVAGFVGHSAAMTADAVHSLSDFVTDIIVLFFIHLSNKPQDKGHDYGHGKCETMATVFIGAILLFIGLGIMKDSILSIWHFAHGEVLPDPEMIAWIAALVSIALKEVLFRYTIIKGKSLDSSAVTANAWHHRSDALSSVGTAVGIGGAILLGGGWRVLDPIAAFIVSIFIIKASIGLLIPSFEELTEESLPEQTEKEIEAILLSFPEVSNPHHLRTRRIGNYCAVDVHIRMDKDMNLEVAHGITVAIERKLKDRLGEGTLISIHVEPKK